MNLNPKSMGHKSAWFYEETSGLDIYIQGWAMEPHPSVTRLKIPRRYLEGYVRRARRAIARKRKPTP